MSNQQARELVSTQEEEPGFLGSLDLTSEDSWQDLVDQIERAESPEIRMAAASQLTSWCRENLPDDARLASFIAQDGLGETEKTATLGRLVSLLARNEFLLGTAFHGKRTANWEHRGSDDGEYPSHYIQSVGLDKLADSVEKPWCTSFVGSQMARAGFDFNQRSEAGGRSIFWSGSRLERYAKQGTTQEGGRIPRNQRMTQDGSSEIISAGAWSSLERDLLATETETERLEVVKKFTAENGEPQAGDILIQGENHNYRGKSKSHTTMVEGYDPSDATLFLLEGNAYSQVKGQSLELTDPYCVSKIIYTARMGVDQFDDPGNTLTGRGPGKPGEAVSEQQLLGELLEINAALSSLAVGKGDWLRGTFNNKELDPDASISELTNGKRHSPKYRAATTPTP